MVAFQGQRCEGQRARGAGVTAGQIFTEGMREVSADEDEALAVKQERFAARDEAFLHRWRFGPGRKGQAQAFC